MKVLFLINSLGGGGAEKVLDTLVRNLHGERVSVTLCPVVDTGVYADSLRRHCNYRPLTNPRGGRLAQLWYRIKYHLIYHWLPLSLVYRLFIPQGHDVEVAFCEGFATRLLAHSTSKTARRIAWLHTDLHNHHYTREFYRNDAEEARCYNRFDHIVAVSHTAEQAFHDEFPTVTTPVSTIYNPIDADAIRRAAAEPVDLPPRREDVTRLVSAGRFTAIKGYDRLLRVMRRLVAEGRPVELWLLGEGEQGNALRQYIAEHDLSDHVTLWGFRRNPYPYLAAADLFICPSRAEGYSLAIAEALTLGLPVVSTLCAGPNELLDHGRCGVLVANDDDATAEQALHDAIVHLLDHPGELSEYRRAATTRSQAFSLQTTLKEVEQMLQGGGE